MRDLGYRPLGVREGFRRCFPIASNSERRRTVNVATLSSPSAQRNVS